MKKQTLRTRALTLLTSSFITHIVLGVLNSILVIRALGESGIGIFVLIRPTLAFLTTLTRLGKHKIRPGLIVAGLLLLTARPLSHYLLHEPEAHLPLLFLAPLMVVTTLSQKFQAYLLYLDNTTPAAITTVLTQIVKIATSLFFIHHFQQKGASWVISGLLLAYFTAELFFLVCTAITYVFHKKKDAVPMALQYLKNPNTVRTPAPVEVITGLTEFLEPIIVMQLFFRLGLPTIVSRSLYGAVTGFTMPILLMPLFLTQSLTPLAGMAPTPKTLLKFMKLTFLVSGLYTLIVLLYPTQIMSLYFRTATGAQYLRPLAPFILLYFFQQIFLSFLRATGHSQKAVRPILIASLLRIAIMLLLLPHMRFNILGLIYATAAYHLISTLWLLHKLNPLLGHPLGLHHLLNPLLIFATTLLFGHLLKYNPPLNSEPLTTLLQLSLTSTLYLLLCKLTKIWT